ncbi:5-formyltetrahydrofolate cyclo-ligase [Lactobacillus sp. CBA3606]|uniref:5-formyltetrahydrofolate cyclo-ligase n=1 Tax=Lactobacillus sp. CBA3606 TaxID=2099789 RepID=UPI000CFAB2B3|nr:5-formyltetrahydrofolate cyclo-ligase [Lactobacillus sp. CBA3606]AVK62901.1 5-formyltetrahydrofolate cyclo-ligase [Lactobacillus sp. CBA3606]
MDKKQFRQQQLTRLGTMNAADRLAQNQALQRQLFASPAWQQATRIAVTISSAIEVDTRPIIEAAWRAHKLVFVPQTRPKRQLAFKPYTATTQLERTKFGILEPITGLTVDKATLDLILVPGLGYSQADGARIGFGGGYYDRYLADYPGVKLTLAFREMAFDQAGWPIEPTDILLDQLLVAEDGDSDGH